MNNAKREATLNYFSHQITHYKALAQALHSDNRKDEAIFAKVQLNVYDIFRSVFSAALKYTEQDDGKAVDFFLTRLQQIPQSWHTALANAQRHCENEKAYIEQIKLDTAARIEAEFKKIWELSA